MAAVAIPNQTLSNAGSDYINGLQIGYNSTTSINVYPGRCRDNTNLNDIFLLSQQQETGNNPTVVSISTNGINGLDQGTVAINTFYAVYVVASSKFGNLSPNNPYNPNYPNAYPTGAVSPPTNVIQYPFGYLPTGGLLSKSFVQPLLPFGYDMYRRVGAVLTDGSSHILSFWQIAGNGNDRWMWYDANILVLNGGTQASWTGVNLLTVPAVPPPNLTTQKLTNFGQVKLIAEFAPTAAGNTAQLRSHASASVNGQVTISGVVAGQPQWLMVDCPTDSIPEIDYQCTGTLSLYVTAYLDML